MKSFWLCLGLLLPALAGAQERVNKSFFGGVAIGGYDPVAYFTDHKPVKGDARFQHEWSGAKWRFASADHLEKFKADPTRWAPRYGGFCAYAVAKGDRVDVDPEAWAIVDGKLYLNYDLEIRKTWLEDTDGYIRRADEHWKTLGR